MNISQLIFRASFSKTLMSAIQQSLSKTSQTSQQLSAAESLFKQLQAHGILPESLTYQQFYENVKANSITNKGDFGDYVEDLALICLNVLNSLNAPISYSQASAISASSSRTPKKSKKTRKSGKPRKKSGYDLFRSDPEIKQQVKELKEQLKNQPEHAGLSNIKLYNIALAQIWNEPGVKEHWNNKAKELASNTDL